MSCGVADRRAARAVKSGLPKAGGERLWYQAEYEPCGSFRVACQHLSMIISATCSDSLIVSTCFDEEEEGQTNATTRSNKREK